MGRLTSLKPRVGTLSLSRVPPLMAQAGIEDRIRGSAWMKLRDQAMQVSQYCCVHCREKGIARAAKVVDHRIPLHMGGTNALNNLDPLCTQCHDIKTASEATERGQIRGGR